jgi:ornithine cyclodeaminase
MRIVNLTEIKSALQNKQVVLETVKNGFIEHSNGNIDLPEPVQLLFKSEQKALIGDCHVKTASSKNYPYFCIKVASGFYDNPSKNLPVNNGLVLLMSSKTGAPIALFQDWGHLTSIRTAAAGALAASLIDNHVPLSLGVIGTGHQAELQARWITKTRPISDIIIWGRSEDRANRLAERLFDCRVKIRSTSSLSELCSQSRIIVTTTPSTSPLLFARDIKPGNHIIAIGSDSPGKVELEPHILKIADVVITDDHYQCLHHGEFGHAVKNKVINDVDDISFGRVLQNPSALQLTPETLSVVDLTGLGAQDLAIASMVYDLQTTSG